ncbi:MAG TPA: nucleoside phosphorylase [Anaerolineales bacterium]|nr:nucleoside phosphorylase [Anaerolineales bacterium]
MSFPNYPEKHQLDSLLSGNEMIEFRNRLGRLPKIEPPEALLLCLHRGLPERMRWRIPIRYVGRMMGDLYLVKKTNRRVAVLTNFGIGAPVVTALAEEFIAWGVRQIVSISWGGGISAELQAGDIVICGRALRDEGTSHHYLPSGKYVEASQRLVNRLSEALQARNVPFHIGTTWTTDAPYRETREEVKQYQSEGIKTVEMEIAALYALGQVRRVEAASIVVVGDSLAKLRWQAPADVRPIERSLEMVYRAAIDALNNA